ncbi:MAG: hypothetical protein ACRBB3_07590 [Alphaproteobacteria bacterium]
MKYFYEEKSDRYCYNVGAEFKDDKLMISDWALGDIIKETHHDSDIEHYVIIKRKYALSFVKDCAAHAKYTLPKGKLSDDQMIDALCDIYKDDKKAIFIVKDVLNKNEIPYDFQVW